jgi:hypothetical protein
MQLPQAFSKTGISSVAIEHFLNVLAVKDPNFTFRIARDGVGCPCSFVWQSSIQRACTREYSDNIYLNCRKNQAKTISWSFIAPVILDEDNMIGTMAKSIVCRERLDVYKFVVLAAFKMANADKKRTKMKFRDVVMGDRLSKDLCIVDTCKLCHD